MFNQRLPMGTVTAATKNHSHLISNKVPSFDALRDSPRPVSSLQGKLALLFEHM